MLLVVIFLMGVSCGHFITDLVLVRPMRKVIDELIDFIKKWEINAWEQINKK
jgi:hypothetical protein